jgi:CubicO group peptidase (beta-lactamase class C family)
VTDDRTAQTLRSIAPYVDLAWGKANLETGEDLTSDHLFRVASHSKTFTGVLVMQLVERGDLRLDDAAGDLVPELDGSGAAGVTVRELAGGRVPGAWAGGVARGK